jgi:hypothetical protein
MALIVSRGVLLVKYQFGLDAIKIFWLTRAGMVVTSVHDSGGVGS